MVYKRETISGFGFMVRMMKMRSKRVDQSELLGEHNPISLFEKIMVDNGQADFACNFTDVNIGDKLTDETFSGHYMSKQRLLFVGKTFDHQR